MTIAKQNHSLKEIVEYSIDLTKYIIGAKNQSIEFKTS